jgi:hypothetical protein
MFDRHDDYGYTLDENGESCFLFHCEKIISLNYPIIVKEHMSRRMPKLKVSEYESYLIFDSVWSLTLILPEKIENDKFSNFVYQSLLESMKETMTSID